MGKNATPALDTADKLILKMLILYNQSILNICYYKILKFIKILIINEEVQN